MSDRRIEGVPEGYRLGEVAGALLRPDRGLKLITFELIPIEDDMVVEPVGPSPLEALYNTSEFREEWRRMFPAQPKQLEAVIVVPITEDGHHYEAAMESMVRQGITEDLAEWFEVQLPGRVTIREKGAK